MNIDSFYTDGKMHKHRGEDYAMHGEDFFIICDGCSSAENSDITARLQAHIAKKYINMFKHTEDFSMIAFFISIEVERIIDKIDSVSNKSMPLATLMIGFIHDGKIKVFVYGDGAIVVKNKDMESPDIININYSSNAPYYPFYYNDSVKSFEDYNTNYPKATKEIISIPRSELSHYRIIEEPLIISEEIENLEYLYIFSDGIEEFSNQNNKIDIEDTVRTFTNMKNTNGAFIKRRCIRQLKTYEKYDIHPMDDFSMAGVNFNV